MELLKKYNIFFKLQSASSAKLFENLNEPDSVVCAVIQAWRKTKVPSLFHSMQEQSYKLFSIASRSEIVKTRITIIYL
jgi:hypothetical protein